MAMHLLTKANLVLLLLLAASGATAGWLCRASLQDNARTEVLAEARLMVDSALAMRAYTTNEIDPLLEPQMKVTFLPQSVPFYAATQNFLKLREIHPQYIYKEATLNPTNPRDRATDWEADIIQRFRNDAKTPEFTGERDTPMGRTMYLAKPIRVEAQCLSCHSLPAAAPAAIIARYGSNNGFGWQLNEVVGAQIVSVPLASAEARVTQVWRQIMGQWLVVLLLLLLGVNLLLYYLVVRPLRLTARTADQLSVGSSADAGFAQHGSAEIVEIGRAFERLRISLEKAMRMLEP